LISGPLAWFGLTRVGYMNGSKDDPIFAKTSLADALINNLPIEIDHATSEKAIIYKNGEIYLPRHAEREMLYHFARFCIWDGKNEKFYKFRMTPTAIRRSEKQDIKIPQIMTILSKYGQDPIPSNIFSALSRWEKSGTMVRIEDQVIVRFKDENILKELTNSSTKKFKIEELNAVTAIIQKRDIHKLENALSEAGYLVENLSQYNDKKKKTDEGSNETI